MQWSETPKGSAGLDQICGMIESVHAELEQMFWQAAKLNTLSFGVGRTVSRSAPGYDKVRFDAQIRECRAQMTFHAGRALELAMHIVYAYGADRILGREYPGIDKEELQKDRKTHSLASLYKRIKKDLADRDMCGAFEDVYQTVLHQSITDVYLDDDLYNSYLLDDDLPFVEHNKRRLEFIDGVEVTLDHSDSGVPFLFGTNEKSEFEKLPFSNFSEFLAKADEVYYESDIKLSRRNMRWAHYSARDHEYGRPYVVAGVKFFARLTKGVIDLSNQQWVWHPDFRRRWHQRRQRNISEIVRVHFEQSFKDVPKLPEMKAVEEMEMSHILMEDGKRFRQPQTYKNLHKKLRLYPKIKGATPS